MAGKVLNGTIDANRGPLFLRVKYIYIYIYITLYRFIVTLKAGTHQADGQLSATAIICQ